ncbi:MAG: hypothetical protein ABI690_04450 [Chloroflexota bacterium]
MPPPHTLSRQQPIALVFLPRLVAAYGLPAATKRHSGSRSHPSRHPFRQISWSLIAEEYAAECITSESAESAEFAAYSAIPGEGFPLKSKNDESRQFVVVAFVAKG